MTLDADRFDNIREVCEAARRYTAHGKISAHADERDLLKAARSGDEYAAVALVARCEARLRCLVGRATVDAAKPADLQQAAMCGILRALTKADPDHPAGFFTYAHNIVVHELREANRTADAKPAERSTQSRYWAAMAATDNHPALARRWSLLQRKSALELEEIAEQTGDRIAREIVDARYDRWERNPRGLEWEQVAAQRGRGLDGVTFDLIHASVTYIDGPVCGDTDEDASPAHEAIPDEEAEAARASVEDRLTVAVLLARLDERTAEVLRCLYGIDGPELTASETADKFAVSRPRVLNIRKAALDKLSQIAA